MNHLSCQEEHGSNFEVVAVTKDSLRPGIFWASAAFIIVQYMYTGRCFQLKNSLEKVSRLHLGLLSLPPISSHGVFSSSAVLSCLPVALGAGNLGRRRGRRNIFSALLATEARRR